MSKGNIVEEEQGIGTTLGPPHNVILFNDSVNSFEDVIGMLIKALGCSSSFAEKLAMEAHSKGEAIVFTGALEVCELKESILSAPPVNLRTSIQPA